MDVYKVVCFIDYNKGKEGGGIIFQFKSFSISDADIISKILIYLPVSLSSIFRKYFREFKDK